MLQAIELRRPNYWVITFGPFQLGIMQIAINYRLLMLFGLFFVAFMAFAALFYVIQMNDGLLSNFPRAMSSDDMKSNIFLDFIRISFIAQCVGPGPCPGPGTINKPNNVQSKVVANRRVC